MLIQGVKGSLEFLFDLGQVLFGQLHLTVNVDWLTNGHLAALALEEVLVLRTMMLQMGQKPSDRKLHQMMQTMKSQAKRANRK